MVNKSAINVEKQDPVSETGLGSLWITANAGSGKTTALVARVVVLLLMGVVPERIACITYTKAAAGEMRARVLAKLRQLLLMPPEARLREVTQLLGRSPTEEELSRAPTLFGTVLDSQTGGLMLTTIHGFCQSVLMRFPIEAGISPHFRVLDDAASSRVMRRAKMQLLQSRADDAALNHACTMVGMRVSEARFDRYVNHIIAQRAYYEGLWRGQHEDTLRSQLWQMHGLPADASDAAITEAILHSLTAADAILLREELGKWQDSPQQTYKKLAAVLSPWLEADSAARISMMDAFVHLFLTEKYEVRKKILLKDYPENGVLHAMLSAVATRLKALMATRAALACAEESYALAIIAGRLLTIYAQMKQEQRALDYEDLISRTLRLFSHPAMTGWVMSTLDHRIDHLMVDEAQDTSAAQWAITLALVEELIATTDGLGSGDVPRSVLVVGDEKQSIYSFQGAAPELFDSIKSRFYEHLHGSRAALSERELTHSYRSSRAVLTVVDAVVSRPEIADALSARGASPPHRLTRQDAGGTVALYPLISAPEVPEPPRLQLPLTYQIEQTTAQRMAASVADVVSSWIRQGRMLENENRPLTPGDVLILVRTRHPLVLPLIRAFERQHIPVAGIDRLTLNTHLAVRDLLALIKVVLNPTDDLALAQVLRSPLIGMSLSALEDLCVTRAHGLWPMVRTMPLLASAYDQRQATPYAFLTHILEVEGRREAFAARFGSEVHEVLDELKMQAACLPNTMPSTLPHFVDWVTASNHTITREQENSGNQVRIMTVHGAKGLEAPVVLLIDTTSLPSMQHELAYQLSDKHGLRLPLVAMSQEAGHAPCLALAKEEKQQTLLNEYQRLLYVAMTRARDELHIFGVESKRGKLSPSCWYETLKDTLEHSGAEWCDGVLQLHQKSAIRAVAAVPTPPVATATLPSWVRGAAPVVTQRQSALSPTRLGGHAVASPYATAAAEDVRSRGVILHRVLELVSPKMEVSIVRAVIDKLAHEYSPPERDALTQQVQHLLQHAAWIWTSPSLAEMSVAGSLAIDGTSVPIVGQIDRLIETPEAWVILDYKTGRHVPSSVEEIPRHYAIQMKAYHAIISERYKDKPVRVALLWTHTATLQWCDALISATEWPNLQPA